MVVLGIKCHSDDLIWKQIRWNAVNPMSEKPKFGRGVFRKESNGLKDAYSIDKCLQPCKWYRTWLIKTLLINKGVNILKEIGEELRAAREEHGVSIEEAAEDLNLRVSQIENIEQGNLKAFKDVFYLKCFIRDYAKYLGLDEEKVMDQFNEFFFEETSKIPIAEIEKASKEKQKEKEQERKVVSPYTIETKPKSKVVPILTCLIILLLLFLIGYIVVTQYINPKNNEETEISYLEN